MTFFKPALIALALTAFAPALAEEAAGPSVGHPLSPLCDMICGGVWDPGTPPVPDEFRTHMTYGWDAETQTIKGTATRTGGIAGIHEVTAIIFAYDATADAITVTRGRDDDASRRPVGKALDTVTGTVSLSDNGFQMRFDSTTTPGDMMITAIQFENPDTWVERSEILANGASNLGGEIRYVRVTGKN